MALLKAKVTKRRHPALTANTSYPVLAYEVHDMAVGFTYEDDEGLIITLFDRGDMLTSLFHPVGSEDEDHSLFREWSNTTESYDYYEVSEDNINPVDAPSWARREA